MRCRLEMNGNLGKLAQQPFAGAQIEGHASPAPVGEPQFDRHERRCIRIMGYVVLVTVTVHRIAVLQSRSVLAQHTI